MDPLGLQWRGSSHLGLQWLEFTMEVGFTMATFFFFAELWEGRDLG